MVSRPAPHPTSRMSGRTGACRAVVEEVAAADEVAEEVAAARSAIRRYF